MSSNKTYTIELTELEAKVLCALGGNTAGGEGTLGHVLNRFYYHFKGNPGFKEFVSQLDGDEGEDLIYDMGFVKLPTLSPSVTLNSSHTAVVTPKGIKVGCQTFPLSVVDELVKAVKEVKGDAKPTGNRYGFRPVGYKEAAELAQKGIHVEYTIFHDDSIDCPPHDDARSEGWILDSNPNPDCEGKWRTNDKARR